MPRPVPVLRTLNMRNVLSLMSWDGVSKILIHSPMTLTWNYRFNLVQLSRVLLFSRCEMLLDSKSWNHHSCWFLDFGVSTFKKRQFWLKMCLQFRHHSVKVHFQLENAFCVFTLQHLDTVHTFRRGVLWRGFWSAVQSAIMYNSTEIIQSFCQPCFVDAFRYKMLKIAGSSKCWKM